MTSAKARNWSWVPKVLFAFLFLGFMGYMTARFSMQEEEAKIVEQLTLKTIAMLSGDMVAGIEVYDDWYQGRLLAEVSDPAAMAQFVSGLHRAWKWVPNHPRFRSEYFVIVNLKGGQKLEYQIGIQD